MIPSAFRLLVLVFGLQLLAFTLNAANDNYQIGGRSAGMGHASVTLSDLWAGHHNQAGLAWLKRPEVGIYYENRFLVRELGLRGALVAVPVGAGVFGLEVQNFGYSLYRESKYGLSYARKLSPKVAIGVQLNYQRTRIAENYGSNGILTGEVGVRVKVTPEWTMGAHVFNPSRSRFADFDNERVPTILRIGTDYRFSEKVMLAIETEKDLDQKPVVKVGAEYQILEVMFIRAGIGSNPYRNSFGFGFKFNEVTIDLSAAYHEVLGYSPQASLSYRIP
ncbi:MAG: hypothetical protein ACFB10_07955 [Salibacteraceae bacterium]